MFGYSTREPKDVEAQIKASLPLYASSSKRKMTISENAQPLPRYLPKHSDRLTAGSDRFSQDQDCDDNISSRFSRAHSVPVDLP